MKRGPKPKGAKVADSCSRPHCYAPREPGRKRCRGCLDRGRAQSRARAARRRRAGLCRYGGCPHRAVPGRAKCAAHLGAGAARQRAAYAARRAAGLCPWCAAPAAPGRRLCPAHDSWWTAYDRAYKRGRLWADERARLLPLVALLDDYDAIL